MAPQEPERRLGVAGDVAVADEERAGCAAPSAPRAAAEKEVAMPKNRTVPSSFAASTRRRLRAGSVDGVDDEVRHVAFRRVADRGLDGDRIARVEGEDVVRVAQPPRAAGGRLGRIDREDAAGRTDRLAPRRQAEQARPCPFR